MRNRKKGLEKKNGTYHYFRKGLMQVIIALMLLIIGLVVVDIDRKITLFVNILEELHVIMMENEKES